MRKRKTSRSRSHSVGSNLHLTLICMLGALGFAGVFALLALKSVLPESVFTPAFYGAAAALGVSLLLAATFRR